MKLINFFLLLSLVLSCKSDYNLKKIEIPTIITNWNINDEPPSIKLCDQLDLQVERNICFQEKLTKLIFDNIDLSEVVVEYNLNDTLILSILIDTKGKISLLRSVIPQKVKTQIPLIDTLLIKAIRKLPNILPATKTNIGVQVSSSFELPLILKTK